MLDALMRWGQAASGCRDIVHVRAGRMPSAVAITTPKAGASGKCAANVATSSMVPCRAWLVVAVPAVQVGIRRRGRQPVEAFEFDAREEYREDGTSVVRADLPGIDPDKDVELTVAGGDAAHRGRHHRVLQGRGPGDPHPGAETRRCQEDSHQQILTERRSAKRLGMAAGQMGDPLNDAGRSTGNGGARNGQACAGNCRAGPFGQQETGR